MHVLKVKLTYNANITEIGFFSVGDIKKEGNTSNLK
jgi:hypothetical protein